MRLNEGDDVLIGRTSALPPDMISTLDALRPTAEA